MLRILSPLLLLVAAQVALAGDPIQIVVPAMAIRVDTPTLIPVSLHLTARATPMQMTIRAAPMQTSTRAAPQQKATPRQKASTKLTPRQNIKAAPRQTARTVLAPTQKGAGEETRERPVLACIGRGIARLVICRRLPDAPPGPSP